MKRLAYYFALFALVFVSCGNSGTNPEKIFTTIGLNGNKIPSNFRRAFDEIRGQKRIGNLKIYDAKTKGYKPSTAQEYIEANYLHMFDEDMEKVKALKGDEESQPIIDAGLAMFQYADEIYKHEYPRIAKMIDDGASDEEVNDIIGQIEEVRGVKLGELRNKTMDLLLPYADKNGVEYKTMNTRF